MNYRIVVQITDHQGVVTDAEPMPGVGAESGWPCAHALWPAWTTGAPTRACGWWGAPLVACTIVGCPWCGWDVTTERVPAHRAQGGAA